VRVRTRHWVGALVFLALLPAAAASAAPLTGTVSDGSGQGWPLYARVEVVGSAIGATYTDPVTGRYSLELPANQTHTIRYTALVPGYTPEERALTIVDPGATENVLLATDGSCTAPGYQQVTPPSPQGFDSGTLPAGWVTVRRSQSGAEWVFNDPGSRGNLTGGTGPFAIADSDVPGSGTITDTDLITSELNLSGVAYPTLTFRSDFRALPGSIADVDVSTNGGSSWNTVWHQTDSRRGPLVERVPLPVVPGPILIRFRLQASWDWWWEIDDVAVGSGCTLPQGGLVVGNVKSRDTDAGIDGATVTGATVPAPATTAPTPDDDALGDGFYIAFSHVTSNLGLTADAPGFEPATEQVAVLPGAVVRQDYLLDTSLVDVTGTVKDGSGKGWPLYARVDAGGRTAHTDPVTGAFSIPVVEDAATELVVSAPGYATARQTVTVPPDPTVQDFTLRVLTSCAPGYAARDIAAFNEPFAGVLPANWTNNLVAGPDPWRFDDPGARGNLTGGTGAFAAFDSQPPASPLQRGDLITPAIDLSGATAPELTFRTDYRATPNSNADIGLSLDGGTAYSQIWDRGDEDRRGPALERVPILQAAGEPDARLRFRYQGTGGWWWQVDDVRVSDRCGVTTGGALVVGNVTALAGGAAINGARVGAATTAATPADPRVGDGYYTLFSPATGRVTLTASAPGYQPASRTVQVAPGSVTRVNFQLERPPVIAQENTADAWIVVERPATIRGLAVTPRDVVTLTTGGAATLRFSGARAGLPARARIDALAVADDGLVLSFAKPLRVPGIRGRVDDSDAVLYDGRAFALWFDGSDVGLRGKRENVDALELLTDGTLLVSTKGRATVRRVRARGEDLLRFSPSRLGARTAGRWALRFDGSDVGLRGAAEDVDAVAIGDNALALSVAGRLRAPGLQAADEDVAAFAPRRLGGRTAGTFASALRLDGGTLGLGRNDITALDLPN
jgi:carboxypeptidase family protein